MKKISIITITYNAERYLEQTIKSVIEQDYSNIEYIIIDGKSTDGTIDIIKKYEKYITYWISEPDNGIYDAMNKGIDIATGEWINFMNAGDSFCDTNIISTVTKFLSSEVAVLYGDIYLCSDKKKELKKAHGIEKAFDYMFCCHQTMFVKTSIMKKYKFNTEFKITADYDFTLKCFNQNHTFKYIPLAIANFLDGGISSKELIKARIENLFIQSKYTNNINSILENNSFSELKRLSQDNNYLFTKLLNDLYIQCQEINYKYNMKKIILYGYGHIGELVFEKCKDTISAIVDQNFENLFFENIAIQNPKDLISLDFDYILISILGREEKIKEFLTNELNIQSKKILTFNL